MAQHQDTTTADSLSPTGIHDSTPTLTETLSTSQQELSQTLAKLTLHPLGIIHIGNDGVLRSLTPSRSIVDAIPLSPLLIKALCDRMPYVREDEDRLRGVDGTAVPEAQWISPDAVAVGLPPPMTKEELEEEQQFYEEHREMIEERLKRRERGEERACEVCVRSNYDLSPRLGP